MKKTIALAAMCATAFSPILSTASFAAVTVLDPLPEAQGLTDANETAARAQCTAKAAAHGTAWTGTLHEGSIVATYVSGPTEIGGHTYAANGEGDREGAGTFTPGHVEIEGNPYRNGGSVNMFGDQIAVGGRYSASSYDFTNDFSTTYSYSFDCNLTETVITPVEGYYTVSPDAPGASIDAIRGNCEAYNRQGPSFAHWGKDHAFCVFNKTGGGEEEDQPRAPEAGTPIVQAQIDSLLAHEDLGEGFDTDETLFIGKVVVCISPSKTGTKLPGSWVQQNGYTGPLCTTDWYNGGAKTNVSNLNTGSHNVVTVPIA